MKILVNGVWHELAARDLAAALEELGYSSSIIATALNGEFVPVATRPLSALSDGDRVEIVAPMQGG